MGNTEIKDQPLNITTGKLQALIDNSVNKAFEKHTKAVKPNRPVKEFYTRKELATLFSCNLSTIYNWTVKGKLQSYAIGNRVLYKVDEVHNSLVKL